MRPILLFMLVGMALSANVVLGVMPEIVAQFRETKDLWTELNHFNRLPGHHSYPPNTQTTNGWAQFVQTNGEKIVDDAWAKADRRAKGGYQYKAYRELKAYANDPLKVKSLYVKVQIPMQIANEIIL